MPKLSDVLFVSSNRNKFLEAREILGQFGVSLGFYRRILLEVQSDTLEKIALQKIKHAFELCQKPVIIEDDGLFIDSLRGFPGPYSAYVFQTIGNGGILRLLGTQRSASFRSVIAYCDSAGDELLFRGRVGGTISRRPRGNGWGYDPIFVPRGKTETFAELDKNGISHRYRALEKFARWFQNR